MGMKIKMLEFAKELARGSGALLMEYLPKLRTIETKQTITDLVTDADRASEAWLVSQIKERYPDHLILGEEGGGNTTTPYADGYVWVIDPLDGTVNYAHKLPIFAVSIGLMKDGEAYLGVIYIPMLDELFCAIKGGGATRNGEKIKISDRQILQNSVIATGFPYDKHLSERNNIENFGRFLKKIRGIRRMGAASVDLAYVASGALDGYWEEKLKPWDIVAGGIIVKEAGGCVSGYSGNPVDWEAGHIVASNPHIHDQLLEVLSPYAIKHHLNSTRYIGENTQ